MMRARAGEHESMAKSKRDNDLFEHLRARGVRKKVAKALSSAANGAKGSKRAEALAQTALADLRSASDAIKDRVVDHSAAKKRSEAAKRAARTRQRKAAQRRAAAKKGAATRTRSGGR
jgi:hypothetical protein